MSNAELRKAAAVLQSLERDSAARLVAELSTAEAAALAATQAQVGQLDPHERDAACSEFVAASRAAAAAPVRASQPQEKKYYVDGPHALRGPARFRRLAQVDAGTMHALLADEQPQTVALVLSRLPAALAAALLSTLPGERQTEIVYRIATQGETTSEIEDDVATVLEERLACCGAGPREKVDGVATAASILQAIDRPAQIALLDSLATSSPGHFADVTGRLTSLERQSRYGQSVRSPNL